MFRPNFGPFIGIWGIPDQNKNESLHKTDCCNVLSDQSKIVACLYKWSTVHGGSGGSVNYYTCHLYMHFTTPLVLNCVLYTRRATVQFYTETVNPTTT